MTAAVSSSGSLVLPVAVRARMVARLFTLQAAWNYDDLVGTGVGYCIEPALRLLPGGVGGAAYREALARESGYINGHPYLLAIVVGALARAELDETPPERIERFRHTISGPIGAVGDQLVWAGWLPLASLIALAAFGAGVAASWVIALFLILYNAGHVALRIWALHAGLRRGLSIAPALAHPVLRRGPEYIAKAALVVAGVALPLVLDRVLGPGRAMQGSVMLAIGIGVFVLARWRQRRIAGSVIALVMLVMFSLYSVLP